MHLLYPSDPFDPKRPDEHYLDEYEAVLAAGLNASLFSFEDFESGRFKASPALPADEPVLYRGWMLTPEGYGALLEHLHAKDAKEFTSQAHYRHCHHLPEWYPLLARYTSETRVLAPDTDFIQALADLNWPGYFIKDYVKSLNTGSGSLVDSPADIAPLVERMRQYRGQIEGGICVRRREDYRGQRTALLRAQRQGPCCTRRGAGTGERVRCADRQPVFFGGCGLAGRRRAASGGTGRRSGIGPQGVVGAALCRHARRCRLSTAQRSKHRSPACKKARITAPPSI